MKVAHIFSDEKFIDKHMVKYLTCDFDNTYYYLKDQDQYDGVNRDRVLYIKPKSKEYVQLVDQVDQFDILILYYLNWDKLDLLESIKHAKVKIIWSFYGAELYDLPTVRYHMLSKRTQKAAGIRRFGLNVERIKGWIRAGMTTLRNKRTRAERIRQACKRVDYFLWYNKYEYDFLNSLIGHILPPFIQSSLNNRMEWVVPKADRRTSIIIGNSANHFINHLDAIELLRQHAYSGDISIPFSYRVDPIYEKQLKRFASLSGLNIRFIESFMPYEEFVEMVNEHSTAVYPSFRQIGLGNIFIAIRCGLKIYLSENNPTLKWLKEKGMKIYSIEGELGIDLQEGNLKLSQDHLQLNNDIYSTMVDPENDQRFFEELKSII